ncbi:hypothetical protein CRUP_026165, partial [Coryphaenoides rupestris]
TEYHLGLLKAKLAKYRAQLLEPSKSAGAKGEGFDVMKSGDARVALIGFPSVGKSTFLSLMTSTASEAASYEFTTLTCIPGVIEYKGANIQFLICQESLRELPKGRGPAQVIAVARTADVVIMMLDANQGRRPEELLEKELESVGIRLNRMKPKYLLQEIFNAEDSTADEFIDVIVGNRVYMPCLYVYNKVDQISIEEVDRLAHVPNSVVISCGDEAKLEYLSWRHCGIPGHFICIYTKKRGERPDFGDAIIMRRGASVEHVCHRIHRTLANQFKYALVWRVGLTHIMEHEDVIQIVKK